MPSTRYGFVIEIQRPFFSDGVVDVDDLKLGFEAGLMRHIRIVSAERKSEDISTTTDWLARAIFDFDVAPEFCNPMHNMHGGAVGLLADMTTTMATAPLAAPGWWEFGGVSRTLGTTFLSPLLMGSTVRVDCKVMSMGRKLG